MRIDVIDEFSAFERLKPDWDDVYDADPDAQFFLSWTWLSKWIPMLSDPWFILALNGSKPTPVDNGPIIDS